MLRFSPLRCGFRGDSVARNSQFFVCQDLRLIHLWCCFFFFFILKLQSMNRFSPAYSKITTKMPGLTPIGKTRTICRPELFPFSKTSIHVIFGKPPFSWVRKGCMLLAFGKLPLPWRSEGFRALGMRKTSALLTFGEASSVFGVLVVEYSVYCSLFQLENHWIYLRVIF